MKSRGIKRAALLGPAIAAGMLLMAAPALAQGILPADFFNAPLDQSAPAAVEANQLTFNSDSNVITATGDVVVSQGGYTATGQDLVYDRSSGEVRFIGKVTVRDPSGNLLETEDLEMTGGMREAFIDALTITSYDGARITADSADYDAALETILVNATYAPCGDCIDEEGRRIGWSMRAAKVVHNSEDGSVYLEQPSLAILGIPVAWLPYLWLPDTSDSVLANLRMPIYDYADAYGHRLDVPYYAYSSRWTDIILTPALMSRQGFLMSAEWLQRFDNGSLQVKASGLYQLDRSAFAGQMGDRDWRGAIQTSGEFTPIDNWTTGWSYTAFSDAAYLTDYEMTNAKSSVDQVYATHVSDDTFIDARVQRFNVLGNVTFADQGRQGMAVPAVRFDHLHELGGDMGRIEISGKLLGVSRAVDATATLNGVPYTFGYAGDKQHAAFQAAWQTQWIAPGGFVVTPYLGGRADLAYYDGTSVGPAPATLWSATPIAAMDVRFPLAASDGSTMHLIEPIAQLVYRGSNTSLVGITNDDAQSFVFDDTNLFSFNRFSGWDRQETGLRANIGGRYQANFVDGSYFELVGGQSFQIAGTNAFAQPDPTNVTLGSGLEGAASYAVLGAYGHFSNGLTIGGKVQVDPTGATITRAAATGRLTTDLFTAGMGYHYVAAVPALGVIQNQHEVSGTLTIPLADYWSVTGETAYDLTGSSLLLVGGGVNYDDGYLAAGVHASRTGPTHASPNSTRVTATFRIKAPAGLNLGYSGAVPLPTLN
jgi:LPS-assembly protein